MFIRQMRSKFYYLSPFDSLPDGRQALRVTVHLTADVMVSLAVILSGVERYGGINSVEP